MKQKTNHSEHGVNTMGSISSFPINTPNKDFFIGILGFSNLFECSQLYSNINYNIYTSIYKDL